MAQHGTSSWQEKSTSRGVDILRNDNGSYILFFLGKKGREKEWISGLSLLGCLADHY